MQISRRGLLTGLVALVAAPAIVRVESLMALPTRGWMEGAVASQPLGNSLLTINMITQEAVSQFINSNAFIKSMNEQYEKEFSAEYVQIGQTMRIRLPWAGPTLPCDNMGPLPCKG